MLHIQYIGLLNTDQVHKGPVRMFLQGQGTDTRYVLDRLPPWIEAFYKQAQETFTDVRYISGASLELLGPVARAVVHQQLVEGGYKVRPLCGSADYRLVGEVFIP